MSGLYENMNNDESAEVWFITILEKHTYTHIDHTLIYHLLTQGQILLDFLLSPPPLRELVKALTSEKENTPLYF